MTNVGILAVSHYVPEKILTNKDLEKKLDTSDEWIRSRTGIEERRVASDDETTASIGTVAASRVLEKANCPADQVDLIIVATMTPDSVLPAVSCRVQAGIGAKNAGAFDVNIACSGFAYALAMGCSYVTSGMANKVLVIGADVMTRVMDWSDRGTCVLFGDGAGAVLLGEVAEGYGLAPLKLDITTLSDPLEFWDTLERTGPDLLILDLDMPFLSGIELCRGVRSSPRWWELPVLFLSASSDEENLQRLFTVGADDFVPKPFHGPELATRVVNRLVRSTNQTTSDKADFKSGLDGLRSVLGEERWKDSAFVIALIKVWNDSTLVNEIGATTVSQLNRKLGVRLADRLRGIGTVARWRSNEFVVALPNQTLDAGTHLLQTLVTQEEVVNFDYGQDNQVEFRVVAGTTRMLHATDSLDAALRLCQQALKKVDGENVRVASEEMVESLIPAEAEKCQLLILEPDQATGQAVEKLLKDCGYQPLWEPKTDVAVARLTSEPPTLEAKAIFISSGGLNLLEQLGPVSKMVNVVVAVSSEKDLISAFESGAYDCIEKPCKVGTLLKRLERAVGA